MSDADNTPSASRGEGAPNASTPQLSSAPATFPTSPVHVVLQSSHSRIRRILAVMGWIGFLFTALLLVSQWSVRHAYFDTSEGVRERFHSGAREGRNKVAIIEVEGILLKGDGFVKRQIDLIRRDPHVKAVVLRVNSPGGTVSTSDYIYHHLNKLRRERQIPLVVSMGSIAASGGYYVSMAVGDEPRAVFAEPTTSTGSIGVIIPHYDLSGLLAKLDVEDDSIASHPRKQLLSMTRSLNETERAVIQQHVNDLFNRFKSIVKSGRPELRRTNQQGGLMDPETDRNLATGELFPAPRAEEYGLVDEIGFLEDAIARVIDLAGLDPQQARVVEYEQPFSMKNLFGLARAAKKERQLPAFWEMGTFRAYYLAPTLPPLLSLQADRSSSSISLRPSPVGLRPSALPGPVDHTSANHQ